MKILSQERYEARAQIAKALAHPTRLMLLDALQQKVEMCVHEMTDLAGVDQSTVSKHLATLKQSGLVGIRRQGTTSYYSLKCACLEGFFGCIETVLEENFKAHQELISSGTERT